MSLFTRSALSACLLGGLALVRVAAGTGEIGPAPAAGETYAVAAGGGRDVATAAGGSDAEAASGTDAPPPEIAAAINRLRGVRFEGLTPDQKSALGERLDKAWETLLDDPKEARKAILPVLAKERDDNFLIVDLANLLTVLDPDDLGPAADALVRAKVTADPAGTFHAAATMAAMHCLPCLPAVLRILEIKDADTGLGEHGLPIDPDLMLIFTLGQYGDGAVEPLTAKLTSGTCIVRGNAALALGFLEPPAIPAAIRAIATGESCEEGRARAWLALGLLDDPQLAAEVAKRLKSAPSPAKAERLGMVHALGSEFSPAAARPLQSLAKDSDKEVASAARRALLGLREMQKRIDQIRGMRAEIPASKHDRLVRRLEKAARSGHVRLDRDPDEMLATLNAADVPLLNRARAAVLARLSEECLDEYFPLTHAVRSLRGPLAQPTVDPAKD